VLYARIEYNLHERGDGHGIESGVTSMTNLYDTLPSILDFLIC